MQDIKNYLDSFSAVAANPKAQLDAAVKDGRKIIGSFYYCPQELAYAAGMLPFGIWGSENTSLAESKKYFPAFICSVLQTSLELGIKGAFDQLTAVMIPVLCDSLKCMTQNFAAGVPKVEVIPVVQAQNRKTEAGLAFMVSQYGKIRKRLEEISGNQITDEKLAEAIKVYNEHRKMMRKFTQIAAKYPNLVSPAQRSAVIKSGHFMDKARHTEQVAGLIEALKKQPIEVWKGKKVLVTGILADSTSILQILEDYKIAVMADDVASESRLFRTDVPVTADPIEGLAKQIALIDGCSLLYDKDKKRGLLIADLVKKSGANGVIVLLTKFCDPEEFDYPIMRKQFQDAGIPHIMVEVDQQMTNYEQARTAVQAFGDIL